MDLYKTIKKPKKRLPGGGEKPRIGNLEEHLVAFIDTVRVQNLRVTCKVRPVSYMLATLPVKQADLEVASLFWQAEGGCANS